MLEKKVVSQCINSDYCRGWNDAVDEMPRWIPVEERLPEKGERVLVTNGPGGGFVCESYLNVSGKWMRAESELVFMTPRSWMPLPEPPKEE